jgi:hypothetical protein
MKFTKGKVNARQLGLTQGPMSRLGQTGLRILAGRSVKVARQWRNGKVDSTSKEDKLKIKRRLVKLYGESEARRFWPNLEKKLTNPALAQLVLLAGIRSKAFMDALIAAPSVRILNAALKLDVFDKPIPKSDPFHLLLSINPTFGSIGFRYRLAAELIKEKMTITDLACGNLLPLRLLGESFPELLPEDVIACDTTSESEIVKSCRDYARTLKTEDVKLDFRREDLFRTLESLPDKSQDTILANGICSYLSKKELRRLVSLAISKLKPGGQLMTDLQLEGWSMEQNIEVLGWNADITLSKGVDGALRTMEWATRRVPLKSGVYYVNPCIKNPKNFFEVLFVMTPSHQNSKHATRKWLFYFLICFIIGYVYANEERASCS